MEKKVDLTQKQLIDDFLLTYGFDISRSSYQAAEASQTQASLPLLAVLQKYYHETHGIFISIDELIIDIWPEVEAEIKRRGITE